MHPAEVGGYAVPGGLVFAVVCLFLDSCHVYNMLNNFVVDTDTDCSII